MGGAVEFSPKIYAPLHPFSLLKGALASVLLSAF